MIRDQTEDRKQTRFGVLGKETPQGLRYYVYRKSTMKLEGVAHPTAEWAGWARDYLENREAR